MISPTQARYRKTLAHLHIPVVLAATACGGGISDPDTQSAIFQGLDPAVVAETIDMPQEAREDKPRSAYDSQNAFDLEIAQAAYVVEVCRDMDVAYRTWINTGTPPQLSPEPKVDPVVDTGLYEEAANAINAGDVDLLFEWLAGVEGCGGWVPSAPGSSETIQKTYETS